MGLSSTIPRLDASINWRDPYFEEIWAPALGYLKNQVILWERGTIWCEHLVGEAEMSYIYHINIQPQDVDAYPILRDIEEVWMIFPSTARRVES